MFRNLLFVFGLVVSLHGPADAQNRAASEGWVQYKLDAHTAETNPNPHHVTAAQIGAATFYDLSWALVTNRVTVLHGTNQWIDGDGGVWRVTYALETNVVCTFSNPFGLLIAPDYYSSPESAPYTSAIGQQIIDNVWIIRFNLQESGAWEVVNTEFGESWTGYGTTLPVTTSENSNFGRTCYGTATFDYSVTPYGPPITQRVDKVATERFVDAAMLNAPPQTLTSTDGMLRWDAGFSKWYRTILTNGYELYFEVTP